MYDHSSGGGGGGIAFTGMGLASTGLAFHPSSVVWIAILLVLIGVAAVMTARRTRKVKR